MKGMLKSIPFSIQGLIFFPCLVILVLFLKLFCPEAAGDMCFADYFAAPVFMPIVFLYKFFGGYSSALGQELILILLYWAFVGFVLGLSLDLLKSLKDKTPDEAGAPEKKS